MSDIGTRCGQLRWVLKNPPVKKPNEWEVSWETFKKHLGLSDDQYDFLEQMYTNPFPGSRIQAAEEDDTEYKFRTIFWNNVIAAIAILGSELQLRNFVSPWIDPTERTLEALEETLKRLNYLLLFRKGADQATIKRQISETSAQIANNQAQLDGFQQDKRKLSSAKKKVLYGLHYTEVGQEILRKIEAYVNKWDPPPKITNIPGGLSISFRAAAAAGPAHYHQYVH